MNDNFGDKLIQSVADRQSCLVVGLDPVLERLPREVLGRLSGGSPAGAGYTARAAAALGLFLGRVIEAVKSSAVAVKPNSAFFERFGAAGFEVLTQVCRQAKRAGLLVILDGKRGDIGHTAEAYADAFLGTTPDTPGPSVDAVTVNPLLGTDSLEPFLKLSQKLGKGLFTLVRTSNPSAGELQDLDVGGEPLYLRIAACTARWGESLRGASGFSSVGAVVGATAPEEARRIRAALPWAPFLVPGYGAQGAQASQLQPCFASGGRGAVVNASRSVLFAYETEKEVPWEEAIRRAAERARIELEAIRTAVR